MSSYTDLATARDAARATISSAGAARGWPSASTAAMLLDVDAAATAADGWFSSSATECEAFWTDLHGRYSFWDGGLDGMDKIGSWIAAEAYLTESKAATAEAQSATTIVGGTAAGAAADIGEVAAAGGEAAGTALDLMKKPATWAVLGVGLVAFLAWYGNSKINRVIGMGR